MASNTIKTRIQLKNDTEAHWDLATNFVPLAGELIIYSADNAHPFSRLKVGDGVTTVTNLPFIDASTLSGVNINNIEAQRVSHTLTFGAGGVYQFDGSADVTVPVYTGDSVY